MKKSATPTVFDEQALYKDLVHSAKAVGVSATAAEVMAAAIAKQVAQRLVKRAAITDEDLNRFVAAAAEKYNKDLAYFYQNRGKII